MVIDRKKWGAEFAEKPATLPWLCPGCQRTMLVLEEGSFHQGETGASIESMKHEASEASWLDGRFTTLLRCGACRGVIGVLGTYRLEERMYYDPEGRTAADYTTYYRPQFFTDAPHIIPILEEVPSEVGAELKASFQQFWGDSESCANHIRSVVELILTAKRVPKTSGRGGRSPKRGGRLTLHARIERFGETAPGVADQMMAIKWIGNAGSHSQAITRDDLLDGYDLMAVVLNELFVRSERRIGALSRAINRQRGPRSKKRGI
jgi:hypothetical protein